MALKSLMATCNPWLNAPVPLKTMSRSTCPIFVDTDLVSKVTESFKENNVGPTSQAKCRHLSLYPYQRCNYNLPYPVRANTGFHIHSMWAYSYVVSHASSSLMLWTVFVLKPRMSTSTFNTRNQRLNMQPQIHAPQNIRINIHVSH